MTGPRTARDGAPSCTRPMSSDVPPISHVTTSPIGTSAPAAATPAAGPEPTSAAGRRCASSNVTVPPFECTRSTGTRRPRAVSAVATALIGSSAPAVYALSSAAMVRSYSRIAGWSAAPELTGMPGSAASSAATAACSCAGSRNDHRNDTASASTPCCSTRRRPAATTSSTSSGRSTAPLRSMRSSIPTMHARVTSCGGGASQPSSTTSAPRAIGTSASNPRVVSKPTRRPDRVAIKFVTTVVPKPKRSVDARIASSARPARRATASQASRTPAPTSGTVVGTLARQSPR